MGYEIRYSPQVQHSGQRRSSFSRVWFLSAGFFLTFALVMPYLWPEGAEFLRRMIFPGDQQILGQAVEAMMAALNEGEGFATGLVVFCEQVISAGQLGT